MNKPYAAIFDLDGTLFDISHRLHHIRNGKKDYAAFFAGIGDDTPKEHIWDLLSMVHGDGTRIIFVSGRGEDCQATTVLKLAESLSGIVSEDHTYLCDWIMDRLFMRQVGDHRPDYVIKEEIYRNYIEPHYNVRFVVDDRQSVVDMWRRIGLTCLQCEQWDDNKEKSILSEAFFWPDLLHIMVGPSGSGKSSYVSQKFPPEWCISSDDFRTDITGNKADQSKNEIVFSAVHAVAKARLSHGLPTIIDATNLRRKDRLACVELAPKDSVVRYHVIDRPFEEAWETRGWRGEWMKKHYQIFASQKEEILRGDDLPNVKVNHVVTKEAKNAA